MPSLVNTDDKWTDGSDRKSHMHARISHILHSAYLLDVRGELALVEDLGTDGALGVSPGQQQVLVYVVLQLVLLLAHEAADGEPAPEPEYFFSIQI